MALALAIDRSQAVARTAASSVACSRGSGGLAVVSRDGVVVKVVVKRLRRPLPPLSPEPSQIQNER